jgi:hypothetical protein
MGSSNGSAHVRTRRYGANRLGLLWLDVRPAAMDCDDNLAVAQYRHGVPHGGVGNSVLLGKAPLAGKLRRNLALCDPPLNIVRNLHIGIFRPKGIDRTSAHVGNSRVLAELR